MYAPIFDAHYVGILAKLLAERKRMGELYNKLCGALLAGGAVLRSCVQYILLYFFLFL
jgi:hypothetical protein